MLHPLRRLFHLWRVYAYLDFLFMARSPGEVAWFYAADLILSVTTAMSTLLLAERFQGIGPWTRDQIVFMLGYAIVAGGLLQLGFGYNVLHISRRLGRGQLDHTFIQPLPLWLALLTEGFVPFSGATELLPGLALMGWARARLPIAWSPAWLAMLLVNLVASATVQWSFNYAWGSLAFWAPRAAEEINSSTTRLMDQLRPFPLDGAGPMLAGGLLSVLPAGFLAWYPCRALLGLDGWPYAPAMTPLAALATFTIALAIFTVGLRHYGRTGSQRYSTFGHRR